MDILGKIKVLQGEREWKDYKLAQEADIPLTTLSAIFSRKNTPKLETLRRICNAFGITLSQFFLEDEEVEILSAPEREMLHGFRRLSAKQKQALIALLSE